MFENTMCSSNLQGTQVKETGRWLQARDLSPFSNSGQMFERDHFLANLSSYFRCYPWDWGNRTASFQRDVFISRILNERCNQIEVYLNRMSI